MRHATHRIETCHMYECVMPHIELSQVTCMNESCHTYVHHLIATDLMRIQIYDTTHLHMCDMTHLHMCDMTHWIHV